ncbi:hypothetical protein E2C01_060144 [Portunus trituberculatus]|uniref:Uncharacterized protein n=1 Tax=Portunus trituberculatus TaxID=210409 RepID=A0A5B7H073_PORTR|nr:hypothetical protein [Portunus trituberculatus]
MSNGKAAAVTQCQAGMTPTSHESRPAPISSNMLNKTFTWVCTIRAGPRSSCSVTERGYRSLCLGWSYRALPRPFPSFVAAPGSSKKETDPHWYAEEAIEVQIIGFINRASHLLPHVFDSLANQA